MTQRSGVFQRADGRAIRGRAVRAEEPLAPYTTFKVGGPAEWFLEARSSDDIVDALRMAHAGGVRVTLLGGGSNVLVGDRGVRGLVIRPRGGVIEQIDARARARRCCHDDQRSGPMDDTARHRGAGSVGRHAWHGWRRDFRQRALRRPADWRARRIGAAGRRRTATTRDLSRDEMEFGYDRSRLQKTGEVLLSAVFRVSTGDPTALRDVARQSLAYRKKTQPLDTPSAGCIFQNPERAEVPADIPASAGALVDRAGLKGTARGDARVSPTHGNFIVNEGHATAAEIRGLIDLCRARVSERFGVALQEEIVYLGDF